MLDADGHELDERKIEDEERRFPTSIDTTPEPEEATQEVVEEEVEGDFLEEDESFDDLDSVIDELFTDDEEESNEE